MIKAFEVFLQPCNASQAHKGIHVHLRDGLSTRAGQSDQAQISIELGEGFNLDSEIDGLRSQVGRLKEVMLHLAGSCTEI